MKQVGRYQVLEELESGAEGSFRKALDPIDGRTIAIKTVRLTEIADAEEREQFRKRLLREIQAASLLAHPNIVTIYGATEEDGQVHIFTEYVNGSSLEQLLSTNSLPDSATLLEAFKQVADALDYAHRKGVVHCSIEPATIIFSDPRSDFEPLAKIADFGFPKRVSHQVTDRGTPLGGTMTGAPFYMSPERIQGTTVGARSDQFSLAAVIYETLSRVKPFIGENLPALFYAICKQDPGPFEFANLGFSKTAGVVLQRALAKDPADRFPSCEAFVEGLSLALQGSALESAQPNAQPVIVTGASRPVEKTQDASAYELPRLQRRRRDEDDSQDESPPASSRGKKIALVLAICAALASAAVFVTRWKPAPEVPVQVLDTKTGPVSPPPQDTDSTQPENAIAKDQVEKSPEAPKPENAPTMSPQPTTRASETSVPKTPATKARPLHRPAPEKPAQPAPAAPSLDTAAAADVEVLTDPPGAKVVVDNRFDQVCTSPCTLSLNGGRHTMTVNLFGYNETRRIFTVPQDNSVFITLNRSMGVMIVTSSPPGVSIFVDGKNYGHTPSTLHLPAGTHTLLLVNGPVRHEETIQIENDGMSARNFRLDQH